MDRGEKRVSVEDLQQLKARLCQERPISWESLPDLALYMDQLISYMPRQLIRFEESETLTSAMVNNYIKDGLLPRAQGKRYGRTHLAYLTAICALKQVLSVKEMKALLQGGAAEQPPERLYAYFCKELDRALQEAARGLDEETAQGALAQLALALALRSYADKLACQRVLTLMQDREEPNDDKKQPKSKHKSKNE